MGEWKKLSHILQCFKIINYKLVLCAIIMASLRALPLIASKKQDIKENTPSPPLERPLADPLFKHT